MKKWFLLAAGLLCSSAQANIDHYMRPGLLLNVASNQRAHCELFNPTGSRRLVYLDKAWVYLSSGFTVLGKGVPMLDNATFSVSNGLAINDAPRSGWSFAHVRTKLTTAPAEVIQGGQWYVRDGVAGLVAFEAPVVLGPGTGLLIRNNKDGDRLECSFLWHEVSMDAVVE